MAKYSRKDSRLHLGEVIRVATCVASALDFAHATASSTRISRRIHDAQQPRVLGRGLRHRPGYGQVEDADRSRDGHPELNVPEQIAARRSTAVRLFSLGWSSHELIAGEKPFAARASPR